MSRYYASNAVGPYARADGTITRQVDPTGIICKASLIPGINVPGVPLKMSERRMLHWGK